MSQQSTYSRQPLTRATTHTNISLPRLFGIEEEMSSFNETSTHLPTTGDLNSTVVISEYARRHGNQRAPENQQLLSARSASFGNFESTGTYFDTSVNPALLEDGMLHRINPLLEVDVDGIAAEGETIIFSDDLLDQENYGGETYANPLFSFVSGRGDDSERKRQRGSERAWLDKHTLERAAMNSKVTEVEDNESSSEESDSEEEEEEEESSGPESAASGVEEAIPHKTEKMRNSGSSSEESGFAASQQESGETETHEPVEVGSSESSETLSESSTDGKEQWKGTDVAQRTKAVASTTVLPSATGAKFRTGSILPSTPSPLGGRVLDELDLAEEFEEIEKLLQSVTSELSPLKF